MKIGLVFAVLGLTLSTSAYALDNPKPGKSDPRVRFVNYSPYNVTPIWTVPGATITLMFAPDETLADGEKSEITDKHTVRARSHANIVVLKPETCLIAEPLTIIMNKPGAPGGVRTYLLEIHTVPEVCPSQQPNRPLANVSYRDSDDAANLVKTGGDAMIPVNALGPKANVQYAVVYRYPSDDAAKRRAESEAAEARWKKAEAKRILAQSTEWNTHDPYSGERNIRYFWRGYASMQPRWVWSNGYSTSVVFPGLQRIPTFAYMGPDGKETVETNFAVKKDTVTLPGTHALWILRDGEQVVGEIAFPSWDVVGSTPGTGTNSPYVQVKVKGGEP